MARLATQADFEPSNAGELSTALYSQYRVDYPFFATRANAINVRFSNQTILVVGCGWGSTVDLLIETHGVADAWGCDASSYCLAKASTQLSNPGRILQGDILNVASMDGVRSAMGVPGNKKIDVIITEDVLPCLSDAEIAVALPILRDISGTMFHIITCSDNDHTRHPDLNWKTRAQWRALLPVSELIYDTELTTGVF